jgi:hypothetical protein
MTVRIKFSNSRNVCRHAFAISQRDVPELCIKRSPRKIMRAQGMPGARCTRSLACDCEVKHTSVVTTVTPEITRHSPRNGFTAYSALSPATNSSCHRHPRIKVLSARSGRLASANLTPATGARTTRLHRTQKAPIILHAADRSRGSSRPAIAICAPDAFTSTASRPALVTTRDRPSGGTRQRWICS